MNSWSFAKGHGTCNDFVILQDRHGSVPLSDDDVRELCDRRAGVGGDGLLRVTKASAIADWDGDGELWFMDYRNADGSIAEMCGNGLRVFVRYLLEEDLAAGECIEVATRAGLRKAWPLPDGRIRTWMGQVELDRPGVTVTTVDGAWEATRVDVGNPHAVCFLGPHEDLDRLDLHRAPSWDPAVAFPDGVNVEFVSVLSDSHVRMRVFERGAGETMSCGTGTVAVAASHLERLGCDSGTVRVDVPGGTLEVEITSEGGAYLSGPAVVVARGTTSFEQPAGDQSAQ